jgi:hypothetical protein
MRNLTIRKIRSQKQKLGEWQDVVVIPDGGGKIRIRFTSVDTDSGEICCQVEGDRSTLAFTRKRGEFEVTAEGEFVFSPVL